jgi:hypothetical protein
MEQAAAYPISDDAWSDFVYAVNHAEVQRGE